MKTSGAVGSTTYIHWYEDVPSRGNAGLYDVCHVDLWMEYLILGNRSMIRDYGHTLHTSFEIEPKVAMLLRCHWHYTCGA